MTDQTSLQSPAATMEQIEAAARAMAIHQDGAGIHPGSSRLTQEAIAEWHDLARAVLEAALAAPQRSPAVSETDAATVARAIYKVLYPEFEDEGQCLAQMQALSDHMGMDVVACAHSAVAALASRPSPERREIVEECARMVEKKLNGLVPLHTFRFNGELAKTADGDTEFVTKREVNDLLHAKAAAIRSLADKTNASPSPPAGEWQWVPKEPTQEMLGRMWEARDKAAANRALSAGAAYRRVYDAMLAAAPVDNGRYPSGELQPRPVAFRVKNRAGEWCLFQHEEIAQAAADHLGVEYQGLYARAAPPPSAPVESGERGED
jgi:hypothetical protein